MMLIIGILSGGLFGTSLLRSQNTANCFHQGIILGVRRLLMARMESQQSPELEQSSIWYLSKLSSTTAAPVNSVTLQ